MLSSTYGIENLAINRYRWLSNTRRAHITNQRTMEGLRDLGHTIKAQFFVSDKDLMGNSVFCKSSRANSSAACRTLTFAGGANVRCFVRSGVPRRNRRRS